MNTQSVIWLSPGYGERIRIARGYISRKELADKVGRSPVTVWRWEKEENPPSMEDLQKIAGITGVSYKWLATGEGEPRPGQQVREGVAEEDMVLIPLITVRASAGHGEKPYEEEVERYLCFDRAALRREAGVPPTRVVAMVVSGDSMEPTIRPGEVALIALHDDDPLMDGSVYVLRVGEMIMLKRLHYRNGSIALRSDNPAYPELTLSEMEDVQIIGRVFRTIRAM